MCLFVLDQDATMFPLQCSTVAVMQCILVYSSLEVIVPSSSVHSRKVHPVTSEGVVVLLKDEKQRVLMYHAQR